jgi:hypothetical protein
MGVLFDSYHHCGITMPNPFVRSAAVNKLTNGKNRFAPAQRKLCTDLVQGWNLLSLVFIDSSGFYLVVFFMSPQRFLASKGSDLRGGHCRPSMQ